VDVARIRLLYEHNAWANRIVLDRAASLDRDDYFAAASGLSFGSLHATLLHLLDGEWSWFCRLRRTPREEWLNDLDEPDLASLRARWDHEIEVETTFLTSLTDADIEGYVTYEQPEGVYETLPVWQALLHVLTHSIQFRAEAAVRLTQLGASPGDLDFNNYMDTLQPPA
jgi:uncharacterized damage-inducible protein DinB